MHTISYGPLTFNGGGGGEGGVLIQANNNTTINGHSVPQLTSEQIVQAYNGLVAGKAVVITDANGLMHFAVDQADTISDEIYITFNYFDIMILDYNEDGTITFKETASKAYVDSQIGNAMDGEY